jgi:YVTN family beta-propeller protein
MQIRIDRLGVYLVALLSLASMQGCASSSEDDAEESGVEMLTSAAGVALRDVVLVGNSVSGTVSFLDAHTFENLGSLNVIPDRDEVLRSIYINPVSAIAYGIVKRSQLIHHFEPSGGDRFLDDLFVSPDGTKLYASRSNLGDVAAFDLTRPEHPLLWRAHVDGFKADHATISPDGTRLVVSATSANVANVFDAATGAKIGSFKTGTYPHQNDYSANGNHIYNSSIGNVSGLWPYALNGLKGDRRLIKVDANSLDILQTWTFDYGIRPSVITPDETTMYAQLSYLNGVIKFDLTRGVEVARSTQPLSAFAMSTYATYDEFPHDSAHHGLALSGDGQKLCDCGTIDNTVSIVSTNDLHLRKVIDVGMVPYWATTSPDGRYCYVSLSGDDAISVIDYEAEAEVTVVPVGRFPQRSRLGRVPESVIQLLTPVPG